MAAIRLTQQSSFNLFEVEGVLTVPEVLETVQRKYPTLSSRFVIWDMTRTEEFDVSIELCHEMARAVKAASKQRAGGRTAFVARDQVIFSVQCMYTAVAALEDIPIEYSVFRSMPEAISWLLHASNPPLPVFCAG